MQFRYQEIASQLRHKILTGELSPHCKLPSLRSFAKQQQISLSTAQACYELLEAQGHLYVKPKSGFFVHAPKISLKTQQRDNYIDFPSVSREISSFDLHNQIQEASSQAQIIHLGSIQLGSPLIPIEALRRSIQRSLKHSHPEDFLYCDRQGHPRLRQALLEHWSEDAIHIAFDDIFITNGCMAALMLIIQSLTNIGDSIILPTPTFNGQLQLLASLNRKVIEIPAHNQGIDLERLEQVLKTGQAKACLLTANYQNPLGYCLTHQEKAQIAALAEKYQCYMIEDDIYGECGYELQRPLPIKHWDQAGYVIWVGSVSKSLSSAYRVGWLCLPSTLKHLKTKLLANNIIVNTPLQLGLADFIFSGEYRRHLNRLHPCLWAQVQDYIDYIEQLFATLPIQMQVPQGGYALWIKLPYQLSAFDLYQFALTQSISIVPGSIFGEDNKYHDYIRINAGHPLTSSIQTALQQLATWIQQQVSRN
ncbi:PLP-dependent aminotransferase family protein [Acinetobacter sp. MB5]|uniref:aminotransferase-like domain-containing protein n=1 Tax=Acinetobacter sp. MB5 TaxID=2069438 RepID=UPI000DCFE505|nr:PLP-dependent aminotransferase family protein [Acinetobacter sp. MB5]